MKSIHLIILYALLFFCFPLKAENRVYERVYIHTDKDCYIAGENVLLKFYVVNSNFQPSILSKVGYIEICDTEKPQMQLKVALENGRGSGTMKIPGNLPSGIYQLSAYTRYMRNEAENVFFKKQIAIVNAAQQVNDEKRFELVEEYKNIQSIENEFSRERETNSIVVKTDQNVYGNRMKVLLSLNNIPDNTADLVISVNRNDSIAIIQKTNKQGWLKQINDTLHFSQQWIPEYEGHIITGRFVPTPQEQQLLSNIAFVGKDIRYFNGQVDTQNGTVNFYVGGIFGEQRIVTSVLSQLNEKTDYRLDPVTPFCESLPETLPLLQIYPNEKQIMERHIGVQIQERMDNNFLDNPSQLNNYCTFQPTLSYDLDNYTRFNTISETIFEFVDKVRVTKVGNSRVISAYLNERQQFGLKTLVLLDGIPIYNHEDIFGYNPMYVKIINIYDGRFSFGSEYFECIVSFITKEGDLPLFMLNDKTQLFTYACPQLPLLIGNPDYSNKETGNFRRPDFRHTLYWNPFLEYMNDRLINLSFYTSDLCGEFEVTVEGITTDGKIIYGSSNFQVTNDK